MCPNSCSPFYHVVFGVQQHPCTRGTHLSAETFQRVDLTMGFFPRDSVEK